MTVKNNNLLISIDVEIHNEKALDLYSARF